ncbi:MAG: biopolymer transporter ExbD [Cyanobacteria bacterium REEB459]|nr:biopolymer transporter ExbD [Cyanobacteria bacterium REEB459]
MRLPEEPDKPLQINVVPMIDVVFAVLVFFMLSSLFVSQRQGLAVALPGAQTATAQPQTPVTVTIDAAGQVTVGDRPLAEDQIAPTVQTLVTEGKSTLVLIRADQAVSHGRVVAVMDQLRAVAGIQLAIATQPK